MSETSIIPADLKQLICWRVCRGDASRHDLVPTWFTPREVMPLDLGDLRKTQRRVATLLGQNAVDIPPTKNRQRAGNLPTLCYVCRRKNPYAEDFTTEESSRSRERLVPGRENVGCTPYSSLSKLQSAAGVTAQPLATRLSLPPVFTSVSRSTQGDHSLKAQPRYRAAWDFGTLEQQEKHLISCLKLPAIDRQTNRVACNKVRRSKQDKTFTYVVSDYDGNTSARQMYQSFVEPLGTLDSDLTWGSLRVDEDYVPMSVSVRKVASLDIAKSGTSPYTEFSDFFASSSSSDSLGVSRDTTLLSGPTDHTDLSPPSSPWRLTSTRRPPVIWCKCPRDSLRRVMSRRDGQTAGPCPECELTNWDHQGWCLSMGSVCVHCRLPVICSQSSSGQSRSSRLSTYTSREVSADSLTTIKLEDRKPSRESTLTIVDDDDGQHKQPIAGKRAATENDESHRVRFAETVQKISPDRNTPAKTGVVDDTDPTNRPCAESLTHDENATQKATPTVSVCEEKKLSLGRGDHSGPRIHKNIHRDAYILALKDAHAGSRGRKKKVKGGKASKTDPVPSSSSGLIFTYFPLLKQPQSKTLREDKIPNLGLRQDAGRPVKLKRVMKHIFGQIKVGEYYPGGKKYAPPY